MLPASLAVWEMSDMADVDESQERPLYDALMALKPDRLAETDWAVRAGVNRGFFTNLKAKGHSPRRDTLQKILEEIGKTAADLDAALQGRPIPGRAVLSEMPPTRSADAGETVGIQSLDLTVAMGPGTFIEDFVESELVSFDVAMLRRITRTPFERLRIITGVGTSHEPKFHSSDQFLIDIDDRKMSRIDGYYWITFDGAHALKRLRPLGNGRVQVISENPSFEPMDIAGEDLRIEGRAIWVARSL